MHEKAKESIHKKTIGVIRNWQVENEVPVVDIIFPHWRSLAKEVIKHKNNWLTDIDVFNIIYSFSTQEIYSKKNQRGNSEQVTGILWDILGDDEARTLAKKITEYICSIPREYEIYIPLPGISKKEIGETFSITDKLSIFTKDEEVQINALKNAWLTVKPREIDPHCVYLKQNITGYCSDNIDAQAIKRALNNFKITIQLGIILKIFQNNNESRKPRGLLSAASPHKMDRRYIIARDKTSKKEQTTAIELPRSLCLYLDSLTLSTTIVSKSTKKNIPNAIHQSLKDPIKILACNEADAKNINSAIIWYFESDLSENTTFSFIQTCIGLEALLGDAAASPGLTKTLADRCAYLISPNIKDRRIIRNRFEELYGIRSKIVHGQISELNKDSQKVAKWGKVTLRTSILKELEYFLHEKEGGII